jgi:hypothetical protein
MPDLIDEAGAESFPASDPPSWSAMRMGKPAAIVATYAAQDRSTQMLNQLREVPPSSYERAYVKHVIIPFLYTTIYEGERPALPMIDVALSKESALPEHLWGMLYDEWQPNPEAEGLTVFLLGLEKRGPDNLRKKIYFSAMTPDLYGPMYSEKVKRFFDRLLDKNNAGQPLMSRYCESYFDLYWDLHLGVKGEDIPKEIRQIGESVNTVLAYGDPMQRIVYDHYMKVRELRTPLKSWIADRLKDIANKKTGNPEKTFAYYWMKNGEETGHFREKDAVFECFHNFLALSQWGKTIYGIIAKLDHKNGDPAVRACFNKTMAADYDKADGAAFTALERFVMELFRTISPNTGSISSIGNVKTAQFGRSGYMITPHTTTNLDPRHWEDPHEFNPDRYLSVPASDQIGEAYAKALGFAKCPFEQSPFRVKDGREAELTNSTFGTVFGVVNGHASPVCDYAGFAPFGFGYRRCPAEQLTIQVFEDFLKKVWKDKIEFETLDIAASELLPIGPNAVVADNIGFSRAAERLPPEPHRVAHGKVPTNGPQFS